MSNNEFLYYKPGLTMDEPITVTMAAADWAILMTWFSMKNTSGVNHIVYGVISQQIAEALYTPASMKAAQAAHADRPDPFQQIFSQIGIVPGQSSLYEDSTEAWLLECAECGSRDEYEPRHLGPLTCEHDGMRTLIEIRHRQKGEE